MEADAGNLRHIAVNADGRLLLCDEDRDRMRRIEAAVTLLLTNEVMKDEPGTPAAEASARAVATIAQIAAQAK